MAIPRPTLRCSFAENPGYLDPRFNVLRASVATFIDSDGLMKTAPANQLRWFYHPVTRKALGMLIEPTRTNLLWHSRDLTQAQWSKTNATITANSANAADGTAALDLVTATGAGGEVKQSITITAGQRVAASVYARAGATGWVLATITEGTNVVTAWFNLLTGVKGSNTAGGGQVVYARHDIEDIGGGLYRCVVTATTTVATAFSVSFSPCAANSTTPVLNDAAHIGDAQFETTAATTASDATSLITTAGATATRAAEGLTMLVANIPGWNANEGTCVMELITGGPNTMGAGVVLGGYANTFADTVYYGFDNTSFYLQVITATVGQVTMLRSHTFVAGARVRVAFRWALNNFAMCINGGTIGTDTTGTVPTGAVRFGIGTAPWGTTGGGSNAKITFTALFPQALSDAEMQAVTRPSPV